MLSPPRLWPLYLIGIESTARTYLTFLDYLSLTVNMFKIFPFSPTSIGSLKFSNASFNHLKFPLWSARHSCKCNFQVMEELSVIACFRKKSQCLNCFNLGRIRWILISSDCYQKDSQILDLVQSCSWLMSFLNLQT